MMAFILPPLHFVFASDSTLNKADLESTLSNLQTALKKDPKSERIKQNLSAALTDQARVFFERKQTDQAFSNLKEAVSLAPKNGPAWFFLGDIAYLQQSDFRYALKCWKKAFPLAPSEIQRQITERISRAELDNHLEQGHVVFPSKHFDIRYPVSFSKEEARRIGDFMEGEYSKLAAELNTSPARLTLIVYQKQSFDRLTGQHDETLGMYDGRIRIGAKDIGGPFEAIILSHELAHAFLQHAFGNNLPIWIQEGYAQAKEPQRVLTEDQKRIDRELSSGAGWIPLKWLDRKFSQPTNLEDVTRSYLQSRRVVRYLLRSGKGAAFQQFVERITKGETTKEAFLAEYPGLSWNSIEHGRFKE